MNKFNLTFSGEILPGKDPREVRQRFARLFAIDDPERLERFFSGETIILRRNLNRKAAAEYFLKTHNLGAATELVKVSAEEIQRDEAEREALRESAKQRAAEEAARKAAEEEAERQRAREEELARKAAEEEAERQRAREEELARKAAEEEAERQRAHEEELARKAAEKEAERQRAHEEELARKAAEEEAERQRAREEELARKAAEEEAERQRAHEEELARKAAEEEAERQRAHEEELARKAAEEEAERQRAREEELARKAAEEEAERQRAHEEELARKAAEEEAERQRAREEELARKAAEEEAERQRAHEEELARKAAEEEAERQRAREEELARKAAEEEAERRRAREEELAREAAEEEAQRQRAREEELARKAAEKEAERKRAGQKKAAAEAQARAEKLRRQSAGQAAVAEEKTNRKLARAAARKATAEEERRRQEEAAHFRKAEERAKALAARQLARSVPAGQSGRGSGTGGSPAVASARSGRPNLFAMRPFRNTPQVRERSTRARKIARKAFTLALAGAACLAALGGYHFAAAPGDRLQGVDYATADRSGGLLLLAGDRMLFHDRAGIDAGLLTIADLGIAVPSSPLAYTPDEHLLLRGSRDRPANAPDTVGAAVGPTLLRCNLGSLECRRFSPDLPRGSNLGLAVHPRTGAVFVANPLTGALLKFSATGELLARAELAIPERPVLRFRDGLLFLNSDAGPAISVLRPEEHALGGKLDEILLLPPDFRELELARVVDFIAAENGWWVTLRNRATGDARVYQFNADWNLSHTLDLPAFFRPDQLLAWGEKLLVRDGTRPELRRFNASGGPEVPFNSTRLNSLLDEQQRSGELAVLAWKLGFFGLALLTLGALALGRFAYLASLVYRSGRTRGAAPVDDRAQEIGWISPAPERAGRLRWLTIVYAVLCLGLLVFVLGLGVSAGQLGALLIGLCGPAVALYLLAQTPTGHIGILDNQLLLVDHTATYHLGSGPQLQYRESYLIVDDVLVYTGNRLLPVFNRAQFRRDVWPLALTGIKIDRITLAVKLLQNRHPVALGALATAITSLLALCVLAL